jgi:DNA-binding protein WhiA
VASFSCNVKEELSRISSSACCQRAELASLVRMAGTIKIIGGQKKIFLQIQTVHAPTARRIYKLLKKNFKSIYETIGKPSLYTKKKE